MQKRNAFLRKSIFDDPDRLIEASLKSKANLIVIKRHKVDKSKIKHIPSFELVGKVISFQVFDRRESL